MRDSESVSMQMVLFFRTGIRALASLRLTEDNRGEFGMKKSIVLLGAIAMGVVSFGLAGCQNTEETAVPTEEEATVEHPATATEHPADAKPKDHPAH